jgi:hypothetical protein
LRGSGVIGYADTCAQSGASAIGRIYSAGDPAQFQQELANYLSAWMNPNELGMVDGNLNSTQTRVELKGKLRFAPTGQVIREQTGIEITVFDSYLLQGKPQISPAAYPQMATSGMHDASRRSFEVTFEDQYGTVTLKGNYDDAYATGFVGYRNRNSQDLSGSLRTLGQFRISKCGLLD